MATKTKAPTDISSLLVVKDGYRNGWPVLKGSTITVHNLSIAHNQGRSAEQLAEDLPYIDRSVIYAALAYYYANRERVERELRESDERGARIAKRYAAGITKDTPLPLDLS
ncbi:MAG: DUF433 domain-containing protein [Dehalococcoidia bacterium]